ncbi:MAG: energy transducer TonB [Draconibacterium sp.]
MKTIKMFFLLVVIIGVGRTQIYAQNEKVKDGVYLVCEEMPEYPGGADSLRADLVRSINYPAEASKKGIQGKVYITFVVDEKGKIDDAKVVRGVDPLLDKEALRVVSSLNKAWTPGKEKGKPVKVSYTLPVNFALN